MFNGIWWHTGPDHGEFTDYFVHWIDHMMTEKKKKILLRNG